MPLWRNKTLAAASALTVIGVAYPVLVYVGRNQVSAFAFVILALVVTGLRILTLQGATLRIWRLPLMLTALCLIALAWGDETLAAKAYPVLLSLAAALVFAMSLLRPPSLVERLALVREPDLPPAGRRYCRRVTTIWAAWLTGNAVIAAVLAVYGSDAAWALWTGLLSYVAMAALFAGEYLVRRHVRRTMGVA